MEALKKEIIITNPKQIDISDLPIYSGERIELIVLKGKSDKENTKQRPIGLAQRVLRYITNHQKSNR